MYEHISVNDELNLVKAAAEKAGKYVLRIEKVGNGNMSAFKMLYKDHKEAEQTKVLHFWRHAIDDLIARFEALANG